MIKQPWETFWQWYERHYALNLALTTALFILQLIHLYWLTVDVVLFRLIELTGWWPSGAWLELIVTLVDYTEIPALITTSIVYLNELRTKSTWRPLLFLVLLNSQWLHLFWITDEFVVDKLTGTGSGTILPLWLAWVAIAIDYLELPVIVDLIRKLIRAARAGHFWQTYQEEITEK